MRGMREGIAGCLVLLCVGPSLAQMPGMTPAAPAAAGAAGAAPAQAGALGAAPQGGGNIWSFFMKTPEQKAQCKAHFCSSSIGQYINNLMLPASAMTGGLLGPLCPDPATTPNEEDLKKPSTSAQGAAAKIKAEEAQAKAKIEAVQYLASVDCRYYPEAEAGMISSLRAEKNECVRLAAAKALASGCCCSAKVVKALTMTVNCSNKDGFPAEASELVRIFAFVALERCLRKCVEADEETPPEQPPAVKQALYEALKPIGSRVNLDREILLAAYFAPTAGETTEKIFANARTAIAKGLKVSPGTISRMSGPKNVFDAMVQPASGIRSTTSSQVVVAESTEPAVASPQPQPVIVHEPMVSPASIAPTAPTVPPAPVPGLYRDPKPSKPVPDWISHRVLNEPLPRELPRHTTMPSRPSGRGNLLNIFQDATRK